MAADSTSHADDLEAILPQRFSHNLSEAERRLLRAASEGQVAMCGPNFDDNDPANDPAKADGWGSEREIRADLIRWLCVDQEASKRVDPRGVQAYGAKITGRLDLSFATVPFPLSLYRSRITTDCDLRYVKVPLLDLSGTMTRSVNAEGADMRGSIFLNKAFSAQGEVRLSGAQIGGNLECDRGSFKNSGGKALYADSTEIKGGVFLNDGFSAEGEVRLLGARIGGDLDCISGTFKNSGSALSADGAEIKGGVFLNGDFSAQGEVRLLGAQIGTNLDCTGGTFRNSGGKALNADSAETKGSVFLGDSFSAEGEVNLPGAHIGRNLECDRGRFRNSGGRALNADGAEIRGYVFLRDASAEGEVHLLRAHIGGNLECDRGSFKNPGGSALNADGAEIKGSVFLRNSFSTEGEVNLVGAQIGGTLEALAWQHAQGVTGLDLADATVALVWDDEASWPRKGKLDLDGFVYGGISGGPTDAPTRLRWLDRQRKFAPQPYRQLAKVLRDRGDDEGAKQVLFELESRARAEQRRRLIAPARWLQFTEDALADATVGYGIYPRRAIWYLCGFTALGWIVHRRAQRVGSMAPTDKDAYQEFHNNNGHAPDYYPPFNPVIYSLENCLPLVKFGQDDRWQADPSPQPREPMPADRTTVFGRIAAVKNRLLDALVPAWSTSPVALRWFRWIMIALGWLLATFFVAGITGIIKTG